MFLDMDVYRCLMIDVLDAWLLMKLMCLDVLGVACYGVIQCADMAKWQGSGLVLNSKSD